MGGWTRAWVCGVALAAVCGCSKEKGDVRGGTETPEPTAARKPGQPVDLSAQQAGPGSWDDAQRVPPQGLTAPLPPARSDVNPVQNQEADAPPTQGAADAKAQ